MNGLRVYITPNSVGTPGQKVFYSRRGNGPYYRWFYEENVNEWRAARVVAVDFTPHTLSMATWKAVPVALQTRLGEHYLD